MATTTPTISNFSSDTGALGDHITSATQPTLIIEADAGTVVEVYNGVTFLGNAEESQVPGVFSFTPSAALAGGDYEFTAVSIDNLTETTSDPSPIFDLTIDPTPPAAPTINDVLNNSGDPEDQTTNDTTPTLVLEAEPGSIVTIYKDGTAIGTATELSRPGAFIFSISSALANGSYTLTAKAADVAGNVGEFSADFDVVIDHTAPVAPTITGFSDDSGVTGDSVTNDTTPTLTITAEHGSTVEVFDGEESLGFATESETSGVFTFTVESPVIPAPIVQAFGITLSSDRVLNLSAVATDAAGNQSAAAAELVLTIDTTAPADPEYTGFDVDSGNNEDSLTSDTTPTLNFTADAGVTLSVLFNDEIVGEATEDAENPGHYSYTSEELVDGSYTFTAFATDAAGNEGGTSTPAEITIDSTAPDAPVIDTVAGGNIEITAEVGTLVSLYRDGELVVTLPTDEEGYFAYGDEGYGPGVSYTATATDAADNTSAESEAVVTNLAPVLTLGGGESLEVHILENTTAVATITATDADEGTLTYSLGDSLQAEAFTIDATTGALSLVTAADFETPFFSEDGTYEIEVVVSDGEFIDTQTITVIVDDVASENLVGTEESDRMVAANADGTLRGLGGDDLLISGSGNDRLDGGEGADTMVGGAGNDVYYVDNALDEVVERVSSFGALTDAGGKDTVYSTISLDLNAASQQLNFEKTLFSTIPGSFKNIEQLFLRGTENLNGFGNSLDNRIGGNAGINHLVGLGGNDVISGEAGNDKLEGGDGNDKLLGGAGNDRLIGGAGKDAFVFNTALGDLPNRDIVYDFSHDEGDRLQLSKSVFAALSIGKLSADAFYAAEGAKTAHDGDDRIIYNTSTGALFYDADGKGGAAAVQFATMGLDEHTSLSLSDFLIIA